MGHGRAWLASHFKVLPAVPIFGAIKVSYVFLAGHGKGF